MCKACMDPQWECIQSQNTNPVQNWRWLFLLAQCPSLEITTSPLSLPELSWVAQPSCCAPPAPLRSLPAASPALRPSPASSLHQQWSFSQLLQGAAAAAVAPPWKSRQGDLEHRGKDSSPLMKLMSVTVHVARHSASVTQAIEHVRNGQSASASSCYESLRATVIMPHPAH